ncbi:hypothetical protein [Amycolatopsis sp. NPDC051061]|uniref:hypothetical protein n=1 Tax=Amycolatopsis sp. NPDC051061 TaxID=3155042 RepID=UPI0034249760
MTSYYVKTPQRYAAVQFTGDASAFMTAINAATNQWGFPAHYVDASGTTLVVEYIATAGSGLVKVPENAYLVFPPDNQIETPYVVYGFEGTGLSPYESIYVSP